MTHHNTPRPIPSRHLASIRKSKFPNHPFKRRAIEIALAAALSITSTLVLADITVINDVPGTTGANGSNGSSGNAGGPGSSGNAGYTLSSENNLTNFAIISGGAGGAGGNGGTGTLGMFGPGGTGGAGGPGANGGAGINNSGTNLAINNMGSIIGGAGGFGGNGGGGGFGMYGMSGINGSGGPGGSGGAGINNSGTITSLTNTGTIMGGLAGLGGSTGFGGIGGTSGPNGISGVGINNTGTIITLENIQGFGSTYIPIGGSSTSSGPLTFKGTLPSNYNIIVTDVDHYGQLAVTSYSGTTNFGISTLSGGATVVGHTYQNVISGINPGGIIGTATLAADQYITATSNSYTYKLIYDGSAWDLEILSFYNGPSPEDTQTALQKLAHKLKSVYTLQTASITNGLTYDCSIFDKNNICLSTGGRYDRVNTGETKVANGLLIGAYKINPHIRIGAWIDQNLSVNTDTGIKLSNSKPMFGLFGVWNMNSSGQGLELKLAAGYGDKDLTITRDVIGTSEAGTGSTRLNTQGVSLIASYHLPIMTSSIISPYLGIRYTKLRAGGYTEQTSDTVTAPLTYSELKQESSTALAGVKLSNKLMSNFGVFGGIGAELDTTNRGNNYSATGIDGLTDIAFNSNIKRLRASANAGFYWDIDKVQRVSLSTIYRQEAFSSVNTLSSMLNYTVGF